MKSHLHLVYTVLLIAGTSLINAQVIINEISYNPPESNTDSLEYIELFNAGNGHADITGYTFTGIEDTLPVVHLAPGQYYVVAVSASAMLNVFGIVAHEWSDGGLNNSGETIALYDADGNLVDSVRYDDSDPWPTGADGTGPSLELIDAGLENNDATNWQISGGGTGVIIEGVEVFGTPGAENSGGGTGGPAVTILAEHLVFHPRDAVVAIGDVVRWINPEAIPHNVNGSQNEYAGNPESIFSGAPAAGPWEFDYTTITAGLYNYHCDVHIGQGMTGTLSVYDPNGFTTFPLDHIRLRDDNGASIFDGVPTQITGVVHGNNFQPTGYSFYIINEDNVGINVFSFDPGSYEVQEGDQLHVTGVIDQFNGLLEIIPEDIEVLGTGMPLNEPSIITLPTEDTEGSYVFADFLIPDSVVVTGTTGFTVYAKNELGQNIVVRFDADVDLGYSADDFTPEIGFRVFGIGIQFDPSFPFTSGYQILATQVDFIATVPYLDESAISMRPNPATEGISLHSDLQINQVEIVSTDGKVLLIQSPRLKEITLDVRGIPAGMYIVKATTTEGLWTSRLVVTK